MKTARIKKPISPGDKIFESIIFILLLLILIIVAYPLIYVVSASFSSSYAVTSGQVWLLPVEPTIIGYQTVFKDPAIVRSFFNSVFITIVGTLLNIVITIMAAYPLSVKNFYGRNIFTGILSFTMLFGGGLIPTFLLINNLNLYNTYWALLVPGFGVYNMIIARTFFQSNIPDELHEAAELDGCSDLYFLIKIVLPLSKPIIAVLVLYYAVGHWNSYFNAMIYLKDKNKFTFQVVLRSILIANESKENMLTDADMLLKQQGLAQLLKYSLIVISSVPMLLLYPFIQKHFVKGVMVGALKG